MECQGHMRLLMQTRRFWAPGLSLLMAVILFFASSAISYAAESSQGVSGPVQTICAWMRVDLHGDQKPTTTCHATQQVRRVGGKIQAFGAVQPDVTYHTFCQDSDLAIYSQPDFNLVTGFVLCIGGEGSANLADYWFWPFDNWDKVMSSFTSGQDYVAFYSEPNLRGSLLGAFSYTSKPDLSIYGFDNLASSFERCRTFC